MRRGRGLSRGGSLKAMSAEREAEQLERRVIREANARNGCQVCPVLREAGIETECGRYVQGLHERRKSSSYGSRLNEDNLIPACNWGNGFIEDEPELVREATGTALVVREGDPEWEALGRRADRFR